MNMKHKFVLCKGSSGMGNRILAACTATLYAQISGRRLAIDWRDGTYSHAGTNSFNHFFIHTFASQLDDLEISTSVHPEVWSGQLEKSFGKMRKDLEWISDSEISFNPSRTDYSEDILVFCAYTHKLRKMKNLFKEQFAHLSTLSYEDILRLILEANFQPTHEIERAVTMFRDHQFGTKTLGVHVRQTDMLIPIKKLIDKARSVASRKKPDRIFLSTDNKSVVDTFAGEFSNLVVAPKWYPTPGQRMHQNWDCCPDRIQNGHEALVDLYLLAACDDLVFSSKSSFGFLASILSRATPSCRHDVYRSSFLEGIKRRWNVYVHEVRQHRPCGKALDTCQKGAAQGTSCR